MMGIQTAYDKLSANPKMANQVATNNGSPYKGVAQLAKQYQGAVDQRQVQPPPPPPPPGGRRRFQ